MQLVLQLTCSLCRAPAQSSPYLIKAVTVHQSYVWLSFIYNATCRWLNSQLKIYMFLLIIGWSLKWQIKYKYSGRINCLFVLHIHFHPKEKHRFMTDDSQDYILFLWYLIIVFTFHQFFKQSNLLSKCKQNLLVLSLIHMLSGRKIFSSLASSTPKQESKGFLLFFQIWALSLIL